MRLVIVLAFFAAAVLSSCGEERSNQPAPGGSSPDVTALTVDQSESTINGRVAPNANGNNNDAPYVSSSTP